MQAWLEPLKVNIQTRQASQEGRPLEKNLLKIDIT